eukprot:TRINITY_DN4387_c0_g5_i2.p1 TRINITY_DN4387_c0_g5~~TRINITY_DN4387_c0_g5_i2.p1  ORF type:complete len:371 (-),score=36.08 TRINITY_DN4387_c0_g5_i2:50-1162(-)
MYYAGQEWDEVCGHQFGPLEFGWHVVDKKKNHWNLIVGENAVNVFYPTGNGRSELFFSYDLHNIPSYLYDPPKKFNLRYKPDREGLITEHIFYTKGCINIHGQLTQNIRRLFEISKGRGDPHQLLSVLESESVEESRSITLQNSLTDLSEAKPLSPRQKSPRSSYPVSPVRSPSPQGSPQNVRSSPRTQVPRADSNPTIELQKVQTHKSRVSVSKKEKSPVVPKLRRQSDASTRKDVSTPTRRKSEAPPVLSSLPEFGTSPIHSPIHSAYSSPRYHSQVVSPVPAFQNQNPFLTQSNPFMTAPAGFSSNPNSPRAVSVSPHTSPFQSPTPTRSMRSLSNPFLDSPRTTSPGVSPNPFHSSPRIHNPFTPQ